MQSMTGFASAEGHCDVGSWSWDVRSVNGRGFDIRVRVPDGFDVLEQKIKKAVGARFHRGNISVGLRVKTGQLDGGFVVNQAGLTSVLSVVADVEQVSMDAGVTLSPMTAADILAMRGVLQVDAGAALKAELMPLAIAQLDTVLETFERSRAQEGAALQNILMQTVEAVEELVAQASDLAQQRLPQINRGLAHNVERLLAADTTLDPDRLAQELALLAVKSDITEELDRLGAHVIAAKELLNGAGPIGRKFDFLTQEFNREANTICSKSGDKALTQVGLELKTRIDHMREQVQNVE